jgi:hypothetical protein
MEPAQLLDPLLRFHGGVVLTRLIELILELLTLHFPLRESPREAHKLPFA